IRLKGEDVTGRRPHEINRRGLSRSFQVTNIFPWLSVFENVRCSLLWSLGYGYSFWHRVDEAREVLERTERVLELLNLAGRRHLRDGGAPGGLSRPAPRRLRLPPATDPPASFGKSNILPGVGLRGAEARSRACSGATGWDARRRSRRSWATSGRTAPSASAA